MAWEKNIHPRGDTLLEWYHPDSSLIHPKREKTTYHDKDIHIEWHHEKPFVDGH